MKPQKLKTKKNVQKFCGSLLRPLILGKPAVFTSGGKIYHTSRVIRLHKQTPQEIHFETANALYQLTREPSPVAAVNPFAAGLAACA